jgi:hypothetical protein
MRRTEALAYRISVQQLDRLPAKRPVTDAAIFDFGIQDTGRDGASWALVNRGVPVTSAAELEESPDVALAWTLRASPHYYRRAELRSVMEATSPLSEADAKKRVLSAGKPWADAGITALDGLAEVAAQLRTVVTKPLVKGEASTRLTAVLDAPYVRWCEPCQATHSYEIPFRIGALYAGLELQPGTSPPVLRRVEGWPRRPAGPAADPLDAPERLQPIRNYLRFLGPATPQEIATFLDAPVAEVKKAWPPEAVEIDVDGSRAWMLDSSGTSDGDPDLVRLLGGFDLFLQGKDRLRIVPDKAKHKALWPTIGRPGAVLSGTEIIGIWRPKASGSKFALRLELWDKISKPVRGRIESEAERLAAHRGLTLTAVEEVSA